MIGFESDETSLRKLRERIVDATIKAVIDRTDGLHLQVDYGIDQAALVSVRQVLP